MIKTILVIGEVTRNQYQSVRLEILREGHQPRIVRTTIGDLFLDYEELVNLYGSANSPLNYNDEWSELYMNASDQWLDGLAFEHIASFGNIGAILMTQEAYDWWSYQARQTAVLLHEYDDVRWVVGERGTLEFIGG